MGNITLAYTSLTNLVNDTSITATTAEALIDQGINELNANGLTLNNLSGTAGSKTLTVDSKYAGAILAVAVEVYMQYYKNAGASSSSLSLGNISQSSSSSSNGSGAIHTVAKNMATQLMSRSIVRTK